ncbi:ATP-binding cassette domain-containing protein [Alloscardovia macacae]|uniref:ABC transporter n=1 Tax=Alloscardovia macacae TaxID=1160091 RepID=A0A261F616_9BIFI|nr:ATP-binding cassette domain-containing protein [Alloscardovia macacae]OZG54534.1 ABC transporter [Alloscardovia macacae]
MSILLDDVAFSYNLPKKDGRFIFEHVHAEFSPGHFYAVMGPSGSGKTTLMKLMSMELSPSAGAIHYDDKDITALSRQTLLQTRISRIYQDYLLVPYLSARDNVLLAAEILGKGRTSQDKDRAEELLHTVGLDTELWNQEVLSLSGGEQQRVAIARAIIRDTPVLLADEPTGSLDDENTMKIAQLLRDIAHERNRVVIACTHDIECARLADDILSIRNRGLVSLREEDNHA